MKTIVFTVSQQEDMRAGIPAFSDTIYLCFASGNIAGDEKEFTEFLIDALKDWYDTPHVEMTRWINHTGFSLHGKEPEAPTP